MKELDTLHKTLLEILNDFDSFCRSNNIQYSLAYGTVLGMKQKIIRSFCKWLKFQS